MWKSGPPKYENGLCLNLATPFNHQEKEGLVNSRTTSCSAEMQ